MRTITGDSYTLYEGDCLDVLPTLEAGSVDAVITDPPYGTTACSWDSVIPFEPMWAGIKHVLKPRGAVVLFGSEPFSSLLRVSNLKWYKYDWVWQKDKATNHLNAKIMPMKITENISVFGDGLIFYNPQLTKKPDKNIRPPTKRRKQAENYGRMTSVSVRQIPIDETYPNEILKYRGCFGDSGKSFHPTQKPIPLMEYLIRTYTNEGDTVLDFTCGSGTTGVAAMRTGRRFIGVELDPDYFSIAHQRIANAAGDYVTTEAERAKGQMALWDVEP